MLHINVFGLYWNPPHPMPASKQCVAHESTPSTFATRCGNPPPKPKAGKKMVPSSVNTNVK